MKCHILCCQPVKRGKDLALKQALAAHDRRKWARQAARSILPNATEAKIFVTGNSCSWRHFLELRGRHHADTEIRMLAKV